MRYRILPALRVFVVVLLLADSGPPAGAQTIPRSPAAGEHAPETDTTTVDPRLRPLRDAVAPLIADAQQRFAIPAISLTLVRGTQVLWAEGFGFADPGRGIAATPRTRYRAGSLAKPLTALAVLALEADGALDIDQPVSAALDGFAIGSRFEPSGKPITLRSLLTHHGGLPSDLHKGMWTETPFTAVADALRDEDAAFPPDYVFAYSNVGYTLLGHAVQAAAGEPFTRHMDRRLFAPLGMEQTRLASLAGSDSPLAVGHKAGEPFMPLPIRDLPAQGLETSASDLGRLLRMLLCGGESDGRQLLPPGLIEAALEPQNADVALDFDVVTGLGWFLEDGSIPGATRVARHGGTTLGFSAEMVMLPEQGLGVAVLANAGDAGDVVRQLARSILTQSLKAVPDPLPADLFLAEPAPKHPGGVVTDTTGKYATDFGLISIDADRGVVCACMTEDVLSLIPQPNGWFGMGGSGADTVAPSAQTLTRMRFQTRRVDGRDVVIADTGERELVLGERIPPAPVPQSWLARLGRYRVINPDPVFPVLDLQLKLNDGQLCMSYRMPVLTDKRVQVPLRAIADDRGIILGLGRARGDTVRVVESEGRELLRYSGYLAERVEP